MKKVLLCVVLSALIPVLAQAQTPPAPQPWLGTSTGTTPAIVPSATGVINWTANLSEALETAREKGLPVMVDFYADWCDWCRKLDRDVYTTDQVVKLSREFVNVKVNTDTDTVTAQRYKIQGLPTVLFLGPNGEVVEQFTGYRPPADFIRVMQEVLKDVGHK